MMNERICPYGAVYEDRYIAYKSTRYRTKDICPADNSEIRKANWYSVLGRGHNYPSGFE